MSQDSMTSILNIEKPIVQAPMNWLTDAHLVTSVSNAGGLGVLGPNAGQNGTFSPEITKENIRNEIRKTRALTDKPFGLNLLLPIDNPFSQATLEVGLEEKVAAFVTVGDADRVLFDRIKESGAKVIHRPLTPTIQNMQEAEDFGADILVATGFDEGGVLPQQAYGTFTILPNMVDAVSVPVLAAGGINDARGVQAALSLGASGVYLGTRFLVTQESPMSTAAKEVIIASSYEDLVFVSERQRSLKTDFALKEANRYQAGNRNTDQEIAQAGGLRPAMLNGDIPNGIISVNTGIDMIKDIPNVATLIHNLFEK